MLTTTDLAVGGLVGGLLIASNFDSTAKWAVYLGLFLLALTWYNIYHLGILPKLANNLDTRFNPSNIGHAGSFYNYLPGGPS